MPDYTFTAVDKHEVNPLKDSWYNARTQHPASLLNPYDYPIEAVCKGCSKPIVALGFMAAWKHFTREQASA